MSKKKKEYITLDGLCFNPKGWTSAQEALFLDKLVELAESFGDDVQFTGSARRKTEKEVLDEE